MTKFTLVSRQNLKMQLEEDLCQTFKGKTEIRNIDVSIVSKHLTIMGMIQKLENLIPHNLKEKDISKCLTICEFLLKDENESRSCIEL